MRRLKLVKSMRRPRQRQGWARAERGRSEGGARAGNKMRGQESKYTPRHMYLFIYLLFGVVGVGLRGCGWVTGRLVGCWLIMCRPTIEPMERCTFHLDNLRGGSREK